MAGTAAKEVYKLYLVFLDENGKTITFTYNYANATLEQDDVVAALNAYIANGEIFKKVPVKAKSAYVMKSQKTTYGVE